MGDAENAEILPKFKVAEEAPEHVVAPEGGPPVDPNQPAESDSVEDAIRQLDSNLVGDALLKQLDPLLERLCIEPALQQGVYCKQLKDKFPQLNLTTLKGELKKREGKHRQALQQAFPPGVREDEDERSLVRKNFPDAPVPEKVRVPYPWLLFSDGVYVQREEGPPHRILPIPLVMIARLRDADSGMEQSRVAFLKDGEWRELTCERKVLADVRRIVELANSGLPINSLNAGPVIQYLCDFEATNLILLEKIPASSSCGWKQLDGVGQVFVIGSRAVGINQACVQNKEALADDWREDRIDFVPEGQGDRQLLEALRPSGDLAAWCDIAKDLLAHPRVMVHLYDSFGASLLEILGAPNHIADSWGPSSIGKSIEQEVSVSPWGFPPGSAGGLIRGWDGTKVFIEYYASLFNSIPLALEDTQTADPKVIARVVYMVTNGIGRGRGSPAGIKRTRMWRTILFSTGEQSVLENIVHEGARVRTISWYGSPFGSNKLASFVNDIQRRVRQNYGLAGPRFVKEILQRQSEWSEWKEQYEKGIGKLVLVRHNHLAARMAPYFAVMLVSGRLFHQVFGIQGYPESIVVEAFKAVTEELPEQTLAKRALEALWAWVNSNAASFEGSPRFDPKMPVKEIFGVWDEGDGYIAVFPNKVREVLGKHGFPYDAALTMWVELELIKASKGKRTYPVSVNQRQQRMVKLLIDAVEKYFSEEAQAKGQDGGGKGSRWG